MVVALLALPAAAYALVPDLSSAAAHVANGTATPAETELFQASTDWIETNSGIADAQLTFQNIASQSGSNVWSADPFLVDMQQAMSTAAPSGATEGAVAGELAAAGSDLGLIGSVGAAVPVIAAGAGALAVGWTIGSTVRSLFVDDTGGGGISNPGSYAAEGIGQVKKAWVPLTGTGPCTLGGVPSGSLNGGSAANVVIPCNVPGKGVYVQQEYGQNTVQPSVNNVWYTGGLAYTGGTYDSSGCSPQYVYFGPLPGTLYNSTAGPVKHGWNDAAMSPSVSTCTGHSTNLSEQLQPQISFELASSAHTSFPKKGGPACTVGSTYGSCVTTSPAASTAWCVSGTCLSNMLATGNYPNLQSFINSAVGTPGATMPGLSTVPSCVGSTVASCTSALTSAGFTAAPITTTLTPAQADLTKPAGAIVTTSPAGGARVDSGSVVTFMVNPNPLPVRIVAPLPSETYAAYVARLQALGVVGTISRVDLTDAQIDPTQGPGVAIRTSPAVGTQVAPSAAVSVYTNPDSAPAPTTGTGTGTGTGGTGPVAPTIPGISLPSLPTPCNIFPFGIPCWIEHTMSNLVGTSAAPVFDLPLPFFHQTLHLDLSVMTPVMEFIKPILLLLSFVGIALALGKASGGIGGGGGEAHSEGD